MTVAWRLATCVLVLAMARSGVAETTPSREPEGKAGAMTLDAAMLRRIAAAEPADAETIGQNSTDVIVEALPFYGQYRWVRLVVLLPYHPSGLDYADNGERMLPLSADPESVYVVNRAERLQLHDDQVIPYVVFFLTVTGDKGSKLVVEPSDVPWLPTTEQDEALKARRQAVSKKVHPVQVSKVTDGYRVSIQVVLMQQLIELSLAVAHDGLVRTLETRTLDEDLPVHYYE
jgi:hypothetical protein